MLGQTGDYEWNQAFSSGGWFMPRSTPSTKTRSNFGHIAGEDGHDPTRPRVGPRDGKRQIIVDLINEMPKDRPPPKDSPERSRPHSRNSSAIQPRET